ncbi:hypothetical protein L227DRAFT_212131 [Lentinus tigrinus ALCF2SS1-6]|uniref:Uncharacterized protein n=1 Tax=Lentinus tigrinus ALCF2SS1-6 TaxID=1328759 RepID=A0A5C2SNM2_9APHY|nr:hypothetical protein L227DRAFT_212131 [Lentinus tigrinus ALCF2SS1-6]
MSAGHPDSGVRYAHSQGCGRPVTASQSPGANLRLPQPDNVQIIPRSKRIYRATKPPFRTGSLAYPRHDDAREAPKPAQAIASGHAPVERLLGRPIEHTALYPSSSVRGCEPPAQTQELLKPTPLLPNVVHFRAISLFLQATCRGDRTYRRVRGVFGLPFIFDSREAGWGKGVAIGRSQPIPNWTYDGSRQRHP